MDGDIVQYDQAKIHIATPSVRYGATAFEGIRAYWDDEVKELYLFRAREHIDRLFQSAKLMGMETSQYTVDRTLDLIMELLIANQIDYAAYLRPSLFVSGTGSIQASSPVSLGIVVGPAGGVIDKGSWDSRPFRLGISSWKRIDDNSMPPRIKCAANYQNARMALIQAETDGYDGALMLDARGHVAEEARACIFLVRQGVIITPMVTNSILESITRDTVIQLLNDIHDRPVVEREIDRTELYLSDEIFLTGTSLGITPVGQIDRFEIGDGTPGNITTAINNMYVNAALGKTKQYLDWVTPVYRN